jgi:vancomycin permeability regulator SanA
MAVIVLGNRLNSTDIHEHLRGRVDLGIRLAQELDNEALVMTGGQTNPDVNTTESEVMREYAIERGVDPSNILVEPRGQDTIGNAYFSRRAIEQHLNTTTVRIATSCYHVARSVYIFEHCFGEGYDISTPDCYDSNVSTEELDEDESISLNWKFFAPVEPGDLAAVRDRMVEVHDLYDASDFADQRDA